MNKQAINQRLKQAVNEAMDTDHKVFVAVLYGSQNYGLDTVDSDIDIRVVVLPTIQEVINRKPMITGKIDYPDGITYITDIRAYIQSLTKGNVNFLETLFTEHYIVNSYYLSEWNMLRNYAESIARMNERSSVSATLGIINKYKKDIFHDSAGNGIVYDSKSLAMMLHYTNFLWKYLQGKDYKDCLRSTNDLLQIKSGEVKFSIPEATNVVKGADDCAKRIYDGLDSYQFNHNVELYEKLDKMLTDIIVRYIKES